MSNTLRKILWTPPLRRIARRLRRRTSIQTERIARKPFPRLVQHFLARMVRGSDSATGFELGIGPLLGLLAAPGAFQCFVMLDKYSSLLNYLRGRLREDLFSSSAPDKYMFLSIAMAITGIVTVVKWDQILPDTQDYLNLAPLPIRPRNILLANAAAIAIAALVLAVAVNCVSLVLFPMFVSSAAQPASIGVLDFMASHALCVILASLFAFCAVFAILGTLAALLPRETFRASSAWLRGVIVVAFIGLLLTGFAGPALIRRLELTPHSAVRLLPPMWYLGLYQSIQHRATPQLASLTPLAGIALAVAFGLMLLSYGFSYRRRFAGVLEGGRRPGSQYGLGFALAFLDCFSARESGFQRASYRFVIRALLRNEAQRFCISVSVALGWLLAVQSASAGLTPRPHPPAWPPEVSLLAAPLMTAYLLVLGLRLAFELPAALPANWIFRSTLPCLEHETVGIGRRVMLAFLTPLVLLPSLVLFSWRAGFRAATLHALYVLALSLCLIEILLSGYRKIPFTCLMPGFRENLLLRCLLQLLGFIAFTRGGAGLEHWMLLDPVRFLLVPVAMAAAYFWNQKRLRDARGAGELEIGLSFDSGLTPAIQRLRLFDSD
jgi:hypothetical protein